MERDWLLRRASEKPMNRAILEALHSPENRNRKRKEKREEHEN